MVEVVVGIVRAQIARISDAVAVSIKLARVVDRWAPISVPAPTIGVCVVQGVKNARIADIAETVAVGISLIGVVGQRAVVAQVPPSIEVEI